MTLWVVLAAMFVVIGSMIWVSDKRREIADYRDGFHRERQARSLLEDELEEARSGRANREVS